MNMSIDEWFYMDDVIFEWMNFIYDLEWINKSLDEIHPWLENKWIQNYLYPSSFFV